MLFNSLIFAVFLIAVFCLYWLLPHKYRWVWLLLSSYYFYMSWNAKYIVLILFTTFISFSAAILIEKTSGIKRKKAILILACAACLGVLFYFKYFNFLSNTLFTVLNAFSIRMNPITVDVLLPVGISFYTFQTVGYLIDVYRSDIKAERHFGYFATFISFFPQLVAGPIERPKNLLPQIKTSHIFDYRQATYGLKLMAWGFFKKLAIADVLSPYVQLVYTEPQNFQGFALLLASVFFTFQIYCDFSGYSDIAIGTAKLFGINLMTNFKTPYFSQSIKDFWSRWHISLSTWFRDYVYIPLGGNRVSSLQHDFNLLLTFLLSGLWHGANWTFVIWGGIHGIAQVIEKHFIKQKELKPFTAFWSVRVVLLFLFAVFTWTFFVSKSLNDALFVIMHMFDGITHPLVYRKTGFVLMGMYSGVFRNIVLNLAVLFIYDFKSLKTNVIELVSRQNVYLRWFIYILLLLRIMYTGAGGQAEFVYFQF